MSLADYQTRVDDLVRDQDGRISEAQRDRAIADAVVEYSRHRASSEVALTMVQDTVPDADRSALCSYAAALLLEQLAVAHAGDSDSAIHADSADHRAVTDRYRRLARAWRQRFYDHLGVKAGKSHPAIAVVDLDLPGPRGRERLTHTNLYG